MQRIECFWGKTKQKRIAPNIKTQMRAQMILMRSSLLTFFPFPFAMCNKPNQDGTPESCVDSLCRPSIGSAIGSVSQWKTCSWRLSHLG